MSNFERALMETTRQHHLHPISFVSRHGLLMFAVGMLLGFIAGQLWRRR